MYLDAINRLEGLLLLDSSFKNSRGNIPLAECLYHGYPGLFYVDESALEEDFNLLNELNALIKKGNLRIIDEVMAESRDFLNILNEQIRYLSNRQPNNRHTIKRERTHESEADRAEQMPILNRIKEYTNLLYSTIKNMQNRDPRELFDTSESDINRTFLKVTADLSSQFEEDSRVRKLVKYKHPKLTGYELETDRKIIACAFTMAYRAPITILTRDKGLGEIVDKISLELPFKDFRAKYSIPEHRYQQVDVFNPDYMKKNPPIVTMQITPYQSPQLHHF